MVSLEEGDAAPTATIEPSLLEQLAGVLPAGLNFKIYHLSTPPTRTDALYSAPPGSAPDRTYCQSHFLGVAIEAPGTGPRSGGDGDPLLVFAVEVLIYSTACDTTLFVSKADSTGYLHLLLDGRPRGGGPSSTTASPLRAISSTFLHHLAAQHARKHRRTVISLFARAQDQYLFPGSIEYAGKHVLDDRGLIKWWCRVLDPLIEGMSAPTGAEREDRCPVPWETVQGYLVVPGLDAYETRSYVPRASAESPAAAPVLPRWIMGDPLQEMSRHGEGGVLVPPSCLIPHFPDDPKARFLEELDDERGAGRDGSGTRWKSVHTLAQFWEFMQFRQECAAGRLVGFIWVLFSPKTLRHPPEHVITGRLNPLKTDPTKETYSPAGGTPPHPAEKEKKKSRPSKRPLTGPIIPRLPRLKLPTSSSTTPSTRTPPPTSPYYTIPAPGPGQLILPAASYKRAHDLLLRLDFATPTLATSSSRRWIAELAALADAPGLWGADIRGTHTHPSPESREPDPGLHTHTPTTAPVSSLNAGLVRKKPKPTTTVTHDADKNTQSPVPPTPTTTVNVLTAGLVRRKSKSTATTLDEGGH